MKCEACGSEIETTFLDKKNGNYIYVDGKKRFVCNRCFSTGVSSVKAKLNKQ